MSKYTKKLIIIFGVIGLVIVILFLVLNFSGKGHMTLPERAEAFYYDNKDILNEFVELCFEYDIDYIAIHEHSSKTNTFFIINQYYVYVDDELPSLIVSKLSDIIEVFRRNNIRSIFIDENNKQYVSLTMSGGLFFGAGIEFLSERRAIEVIKEENYTDNAWYADDNWVIIEYKG